MQPPPTAADLLAVVAEVLADDVVPALSGPVQHHARVAANLVSIVERELRLGPAADAAEHAALAELLGGATADAGGSEPGDASLADLRARLAAELRAGRADDPDEAQRVWDVLMAGVRGDLAIAKPAHDAWEGE